MRSISVTVLLAVLVSVASAGEPSDKAEPLLKMVPADVGACLILDDLSGHWDRLMQSPLWRHVRQTGAFQAWQQSPRYARFQEQKAALETAFGPLEGVLRNLVGQHVVLAFRPDPGGLTSQGQGLLLTATRDADATAALIDKLHRMERTEMKLVRLSTRQHKGQSYHEKVIVKKGVESTQYYAQLGRCLAISNRREMLFLRR